MTSLAIWLPVVSRATVSPVIIHLEFGQPAYVVPVGKTLLVRQITYESGSSPVASKIILSSGGETNNFYLFEAATNNPSPSKGTIRLKEPLAVPAGFVMEAGKYSITEGRYSVFGYLADAGDLYVGFTGAQPSFIEDLVHAGTNSTLTVRIPTPAPTIISVETSPDLRTWDEIPVVTESTTNPATRRIQVLAQSDHAYYRTGAWRRKAD